MEAVLSIVNLKSLSLLIYEVNYFMVNLLPDSLVQSNTTFSIYPQGATKFIELGQRITDELFIGEGKNPTTDLPPTFRTMLLAIDYISVSEPLFWLGLSILLVSVSLTALLVAAIPALQEVARAARSAEKLFDTLSRELPPTLEAVRLTGLEITDLTDDVSEGVQSASGVVKQVDQSLNSAKKQARNVQVGTRSLVVGVKAAWKSLTNSKPSRRALERQASSQKSVSRKQ